MKMHPEIVIDTNVIVAALHSRDGASFALLNLVGRGDFGVHLSVSLALEYEDVTKRVMKRLALQAEAIDDILDYVILEAEHHAIFYLWRPFLDDAGDDLVLELAVAANCSFIVTHNVRHFQDVKKIFGIEPVTPLQFLKVIGAIK